MRPRRGNGDRGSAVVDFTLVGALVTLVFVAVVQLAVVLHVRNTLIDCASDGARAGALADRDPRAGAARARELIAADLSPAYARSVTAGVETFDGVPKFFGRLRAPLPLPALLCAGRVVTVVGDAVVEGP